MLRKNSGGGRHKTEHGIKIASLLLVIVAVGLVSGCAGYQRAGAFTVWELLGKSPYDTGVKVYGTVSQLRELPGTYFILTSGNRDLSAWYANMITDSGSRWANINIERIQNGDEVLLTGQLKSAGRYRAQNSFWISNIQVLKPAAKK